MPFLVPERRLASPQHDDSLQRTHWIALQVAPPTRLLEMDSSSLRDIHLHDTSAHRLKGGRGAGLTGQYFVDKHKRWFKKVVTKGAAIRVNAIERESIVLRYLNAEKVPWCPSLGWTNMRDTIITSYAGKRVDQLQHLPDDFFSQFRDIMVGLKRLSVEHNDIRADQLLVNENTGRVYLIDYGWASVHGRFDVGVGVTNKTWTQYPDSTAIDRVAEFLKSKRLGP